MTRIWKSMSKATRSNTMFLSPTVRDLGLLGRGQWQPVPSCTLHGDMEGRGGQWQDKETGLGLSSRREREGKEARRKERAYLFFSPSRKKHGRCLGQYRLCRSFASWHHDWNPWMKKGPTFQDLLQIWPSSTRACSGGTAFQPVPNLNKRIPQHSLAQRFFKSPQGASSGISIKISLSFFFLAIWASASHPATLQQRTTGGRG